MTEGKTLTRSTQEKMVCGVCGGLADYFDVDPALVRLIFVGLTLLDGVGLLAYLILCVVLPVDGAPARTSDRQPPVIKEHPISYEPLGSRRNRDN